MQVAVHFRARSMATYPCHSACQIYRGLAHCPDLRAPRSDHQWQTSKAWAGKPAAPPGASKSLLVSVFWPAWEWTINPRLQFIATSYREEFCKRDIGCVLKCCKGKIATLMTSLFVVLRWSHLAMIEFRIQQAGGVWVCHLGCMVINGK